MANAENEEEDIGQGIPGGPTGGVGYAPNVLTAMGIPAVPTQSTHSSTERVEDTPEWKAARDAMAGGLQERVAGLNAETQAQIESQQRMTEAQKQDILAGQEHAQQRQATVDAWNQEIAKIHARQEQIIAKAMEEPADFWADKSTWQKTMARIGVWMSALGSGITGGDNQAIKNIQAQIDQDLRIKQARSERFFKLAELHKGTLADAYRAKGEELGDMDAQRNAYHALVQQQMELVKNAMLPQQLRAQADQKIGQYKQEAAKDAAEQAKSLAAHRNAGVTTTIPVVGKTAPGGIYDPKTGTFTGVAGQEDAKAINAQAKAYQDFSDAVDAAKGILKENPHAYLLPRDGIGSTDASRALGRAETQVQAASKAAFELPGRGLDKELAGKISGAVGWGPHNPLPLLEQAQQQARSKLVRTFNVRGSGAIAPQGVAPAARTTAIGGGMSDAQMAKHAEALLKADPRDKLGIEMKEYLKKKRQPHGGQP